MHLSKEQERLLDGEMGHYKAWAMEALVSLGDMADSERLIPIESAHIPDWDISGRRSLLSSLTLDDLVVPTSLNPGRPLVDVQASDVFRVRSCTPYLCGQRVVKGSSVAWGGRAACAFVNSALGARSGIETFDSALAAAITGLTPERPLHMSSGRESTIAVAEASSVEPLRLGEAISRHLPGHVPLLCGVRFGMGAFKGISFAINSLNSIPLFHTSASPEIPRGLEHVSAIDLVEEMEPRQDGDLLILGCPHLSEQEVNRWARLVADRYPTIEVWSFISSLCDDKSPKTGTVLRSCGRVFVDRCPLSLIEEMRGRKVICNSPALATCLCDKGAYAFWISDAEVEKVMLGRGL